MKEAFENSVLAMFDYITEVEHVKPVQEQVYEVEGKIYTHTHTCIRGCL